MNHTYLPDEKRRHLPVALGTGKTIISIIVNSRHGMKEVVDNINTDCVDHTVSRRVKTFIHGA